MGAGRAEGPKDARDDAFWLPFMAFAPPGAGELLGEVEGGRKVIVKQEKGVYAGRKSEEPQ